MSKDYYKTLGIDKSANADEIKRAYKKLAVKYHPDVNKESGAEEKFKEINEAYQVLSDPQKKSSYDQFGTADFSRAGPGSSGFSGGSWDFSNFSGGNASGFEDIFDMFFGGSGKSRRKASRGQDVEIIIELDFKEAIFGIEKDVSYSIMGLCPECLGKGGSNLKKCNACGGSGFVTQTTRTVLGSFAQTMPCQRCKGKGETPENTCKKCSGTGKTRQRKDIKVKIPAGVDDGSAIRIAGGGEAGEDGAGDLFLRIRVRPSKTFERNGTQIFSQTEISYSTATLGGKIDVETVDGPIVLTIPSGTASETEFRLRGKGAPSPNNPKQRGDHFVTIKVRVPKKISREEREILELLKNFE